jgi:3-dehydroquinate synthase
MKIITVQLGERSYDIKIGRNILSSVGQELLTFNFSSTCLLVSNPLIYELYGSMVKNSLEEAGFKPSVALVEDGEQAKSLKWTAKLYDKALQGSLNRNSPIIALGGGVVGDLAGFIAATYMRGVPFIQIPTSLLAQVDSSVGGKVAINHPKGKNLIGAFYQPKLVLADLDTLITLPPRELRSGLAEVIKYGVIWDRSFFEYMEEHIKDAFNLNYKVLEALIAKSCTIKAAIIEEDEREGGLRTILNFGHTFGHAYEAITNYTTYRHGEAVALGMVEATKFACYKDLTKELLLKRLVELLKQAGLEIKPAQWFKPGELLEIMKFDKKNKGEKIQFVLPRELGRVINIAVEPEDVRAYFKTNTGRC